MRDLKETFKDTLAFMGIGGFYRHEEFINVINPDESAERVTGPFKNRIAAEGPTFHARIYFRNISVQHHIKPPQNAEIPPSFT